MDKIRIHWVSVIVYIDNQTVLELVFQNYWVSLLVSNIIVSLGWYCFLFVLPSKML
jgi:hypothetical protein